MALQGDLSSFALPDVLRLLAGTGKSGALEVTGPTGTGEVWFYEGQIVGGAVSSAGHAVAPADVVFELLRLDGGSFAFDDEEVIDEAPTVEVGTVLADAEALVAEWDEVEAVVPSMDAWVTLAAEILGEVTLTTEQWRAVAAVGSGGNVRDLADALRLTDLAASRAVKDLVEHELAEVRASHGYGDPAPEVVGDAGFAAEPVAPFEPLTSFADEPSPFLVEEAPYDPDARYAHQDAEENLAVLRAEERPVVMEDRDDALLPEPLPGEGTSYADEVADIGVGSVDGRSAGQDGPDVFLAESFGAVDHPQPTFEPRAPEVASYGYGDTFPAEAAPRAEFLEEFAASMTAPPAPAPVEPPAPAAEAPVDDDRGSLLKFLSTVKP